MTHFRFFLLMWLLLVASVAQSQQQLLLADCLDKASGKIASFSSCKREYLLPCLNQGNDNFALNAAQQCFADISVNLRQRAGRKIAGEQTLKTDDLGAAAMRSATYRQKLATAAFRRAERIGQAECDFRYETEPKASEKIFHLSCYTTALANAYWNVVVHRRYFFPKIQSKLP